MRVSDQTNDGKHRTVWKAAVSSLYERLRDLPHPRIVRLDSTYVTTWRRRGLVLGAEDFSPDYNGKDVDALREWWNGRRE